MHVQDPAALPAQLMPVSADVQEVAPTSALDLQPTTDATHVPPSAQQTPASNANPGGDLKAASTSLSSGSIAELLSPGNNGTSQADNRMDTSAGAQLLGGVLGLSAQAHVPAVAPPAIRMAKPGRMRSMLGRKAGVSAMAAALATKKGEAALGGPPQVTAL